MSNWERKEESLNQGNEKKKKNVEKKGQSREVFIKEVKL